MGPRLRSPRPTAAISSSATPLPFTTGCERTVPIHSSRMASTRRRTGKSNTAALDDAVKENAVADRPGRFVRVDGALPIRRARMPTRWTTTRIRAMTLLRLVELVRVSENVLWMTILDTAQRGALVGQLRRSARAKVSTLRPQRGPRSRGRVLGAMISTFHLQEEPFFIDKIMRSEFLLL